MPKTCALINLENLQRFTTNDRMQSCRNYQISAFVFNKGDQTKLFQQKSELCNHGLPSCFIHFKDPHSDMHGDPSVTQKIDNQSESIRTFIDQN